MIWSDNSIVLTTTNKQIKIDLQQIKWINIQIYYAKGGPRCEK